MFIVLFVQLYSILSNL